ncbi:hypothetical protein CVT25_010028 [Psilocybe cyanescens]|uniref:Uncharacterized protein n=1 Tax=Psilocybe cyanescens TaxID=93625 RepID=A0A409X3D8_PSICY|nr:hypothetical protein CVT25_010028 [Psilocybe cyanescens]
MAVPIDPFQWVRTARNLQACRVNPMSTLIYLWLKVSVTVSLEARGLVDDSNLISRISERPTWLFFEHSNHNLNLVSTSTSMIMYTGLLGPARSGSAASAQSPHLTLPSPPSASLEGSSTRAIQLPSLSESLRHLDSISSQLDSDLCLPGPDYIISLLVTGSYRYRVHIASHVQDTRHRYQIDRLIPKNEDWFLALFRRLESFFNAPGPPRFGPWILAFMYHLCTTCHDDDEGDDEAASGSWVNYLGLSWMLEYGDYRYG